MDDRYTSEQTLAAAAERLAIQQDRTKDAAQIRRNMMAKAKERREAAGK